MKLLVPTDFSPSADAAAILAVASAKAFDAEVIVLHVLDLAPITAAWSPPVVAAEHLPPDLAAELLDRIRSEAAQRLRARSRPVSERHDAHGGRRAADENR
jgi:nucleotide-binding universal stress UspA family protein